MNGEASRHVFGWGLDRVAGGTAAPGFVAPPRVRLRARNPAQGFRSLPSPTGDYPFRLELADILGPDAIESIRANGRLVFHTLGDTGQRGHGAAAQESIAAHMAAQFDGGVVADTPRFMYHLGDIIYYSGERNRYDEQFYEPYKNYAAPIFGIPGNHDGAVPHQDSPLQGFMENFCSEQPRHSEWAGESSRTTMTQPNCYWSLKMPWARIIGLYSNIPGRLDRQTPRQREWLTQELRSADERCVIVAVHHPPYSRDTSHGGYEAIGHALDTAFRDSGRIPNLVLCGHVHNYQRFERNMSTFGVARQLSYVIAGAGGFAGFDTLHRVEPSDALPTGVTAVAHEDSLPGFLRVTVTSGEIVGEYFAVPRPPNHFAGPLIRKDEFRISL